MTTAWWSKAKEAVLGKDEDYEEYGYDDEVDAKIEMRLPVVVQRGEMERMKVKPGMTVKELLHSLTNKFNYGLVLIKRDAAGRMLGRVILDGTESIECVPGINWAANDAASANVWLVDLSQEVTVFFNAYFRAVTGAPVHLQRLYLTPGMIVSDFETDVKESLGLAADDMRFGLYGHARDEVFPLDADRLMSDLKEHEQDPASPSFFQFQMHPSSELSEFLGSTRASNLFMRANRGTRKMKKCWFTLQGTTLFYRPTQKDHSWVKRIDNIDQCKIIYRGSNKARDSWRFDLVPAEGKGPVRVFTSPLKRRIVRWVRELRGAHQSLEINAPISMASLLEKVHPDDIEPASMFSNSRQTSHKLQDVPFHQRRLIELAEAHLHKVELNGGVLILNGLERIDEQVGRKWVDSVRELLHHCSQMQATQTSLKVYDLIKEVLRRVRDWVQYFEDLSDHVARNGLSPLPAPSAETIRDISEDANHLVNTFRFYVINLNNQADRLGKGKESTSLEEALETMQDALSFSMFDRKARKRAVLRNTFRSNAEIKEEKFLEKKKAKAEKEREKRRKQRGKAPVVWALVSHAASPRPQASAQFEEHLDDEEEHRIGNTVPNYIDEAEELPVEEPVKEPGWLRTKIAKIFAFKSMRTSRFDLDYGEEGQIADDASFSMSLENGDRLSEAKWSEAEAMFKQYSKGNKKSGKAGKSGRPSNVNSPLAPKKQLEGRESDSSVPRTPVKQSFIPLSGMPDSPVIKSGFNGFGRKSNVWATPDVSGSVMNRATPAGSVSSASTHTLAYDYAADLPSATLPTTSTAHATNGPIRTTPEDEAMLLRLLKDPRVNGLLEEYKKKEQAKKTGPSALQEEAVAAWGRRH